MGRKDLLPINFLSRGEPAAAAVGRVDVPREFGGSGSWGTGFLISLRVMITNNHVIGSREEARRAVIEFGYERDASGQFKTSRRFRLDPDVTFITGPQDGPDFTVVAVRDRSIDGLAGIDELGFLRLEPGVHKIRKGEYITIVQHPTAKRNSLRFARTK